MLAFLYQNRDCWLASMFSTWIRTRTRAHHHQHPSRSTIPNISCLRLFFPVPGGSIFRNASISAHRVRIISVLLGYCYNTQILILLQYKTCMKTSAASAPYALNSNQWDLDQHIRCPRSFIRPRRYRCRLSKIFPVHKTIIGTFLRT